MIPIATAYLTDIVELRRRVCYWQSEAEGLREQVAALTDRVAIEKRDKEAWFNQLAAAQAVNEKLREEINHALKWSVPTSPWHHHLTTALALPSDTTALQQRLAEERERCAKVCEVGAVLCDTAWADKRPNEADELDAVALTRIICAAAIRSMK